MGATQSTSSAADVPIVELKHNLSDDGALAGFATKDEALEDATAAMAMLSPLGLIAAAARDMTAPAESTTTEATQDGGAIHLSDYRLEKKVLGEGAFGKVQLATSVSTQHQVAVKLIKRNALNARAEELLRREAKNHRTIRHAHVVRLYTCVVTPAKYYLVMEYCSGGDALRFLNAQGPTPIADATCRSLFRQLLEGVAFCHGLGVYHRDLKLENLMLESAADGSDAPPTLKIADFGLSDLRPPPTSPTELFSRTFCGSPLYAAPELFTGDRAVGYDASKSDVWSCGVILFALLASALPFDADDMRSLAALIQRGVPNSPVPDARGAAARALVMSLLAVEPKGRPAASDLLKHEWLSEHRPIKAAATTSVIPDAGGMIPDAGGSGGGGGGGGGGGDAAADGAPRRRPISETTAFYKSMLAAERAAAPAPAASPVPEDDGAAEEPHGREHAGRHMTKEEWEEIKAMRAARAEGQASA